MRVRSKLLCAVIGVGILVVILGLMFAMSAKEITTNSSISVDSYELKG